MENVSVIVKDIPIFASCILIALIYIAKIVRFHENFKFRLTVNIEQAWTTLKEYKYIIVQVDKSMEVIYSDKRLHLILIFGLSKAHRGTVDGLRTNITIIIKDKIMILRQF
jgi:hypothetical protein